MAYARSLSKATLDPYGNVQEQDVVLSPSSWLLTVQATSLVLLALVTVMVVAAIIFHYYLWRSWESARAYKFSLSGAGHSRS